MCGRQTAEDRSQHRGDGMRRHGPAFAEQLTQRAALDQLHDQVGEARAVITEALVVDRDEPGILEPGHGARLALEPRQELGVARVPGIHHLEGHRAVQPKIQAAVHRGHPAGGDQGVHAVALVHDEADERVRSLAGIHARILDSDR